MKANSILVCAVVFLLSSPIVQAGTVVLSADFEDAGYVIGNDPTAPAVPGLVWLKRVANSDRSVEGVYGTDATIKIVDGSAVTNGGAKSLERYCQMLCLKGSEAKSAGA